MIFHFINLTVMIGIVIATALYYHHLKKEPLTSNDLRKFFEVTLNDNLHIIITGYRVHVTDYGELDIDGVYMSFNTDIQKVSEIVYTENGDILHLELYENKGGI